MKKRIRALVCSLFAASTLLGVTPVQLNAKEARPMLNGMFAAPALTSNWTQEDWNTVMEQMKAIGVEKVVAQYAVTFYSEYNKAYFYTPTFELAETGTEQERQQIPYLLKAAKANGIKVWLGLHLYEDGWFSGIPNAFNDVDSKGNSTFLTNSAAYSQKVFDDLWGQFKGEYADTIGGWYLPFEFNNVNLTAGNGGKDRLINNYYKPLTAHIKKVTPDKQTLCSPLVYAPLTRAAAEAELQVWKTLLQDIWSQTQMDIIAPQDGCGWESTMKETIVPWYRVMDEARKAAQARRESNGWGPAVAWNNPEAYSMNPMGVMTIKRLTDNMAAIDAYVEEHVSFSLHSLAYLPQGKSGVNPVNEAFYKAYAHFQKTGQLYAPSSPLPTPANAAVTLNGFDATVSCDRVDVGNNQPIAGYELWRKMAGAADSTYVRIQETVQPTSGEAVTLTDTQLLPAASYEYALYAVDGTGNRSGEPARVTVETKGYGMALNRQFGSPLANVSIEAAALSNIQQAGHVEDLTAANGKAVAFALEDSQRIGKYTLTCDLGGQKTIGFLHLQFQNTPFAGTDIFLPEKVDVLVDGKAVAAVYPFKEYGEGATGGVWVPVDLGEAIAAKQVQLVVTQKYAKSALSAVRIYEAAATAAAGSSYQEPVNLIDGQLVYFNTQGIQNFNIDEHLWGVRKNTLDTLNGTFTSEYLRYKEAPATSLLTHGLGKGPSVAWAEDGNRTAWLKLQNMGSPVVMEADMKAPSRVQAVETEWLLDRDATIFLPSYIEVYGTTGTGAQELLGTAYRPSEVMLDFDKAPAADNTHRIETKGYRVQVHSTKLYKKITLKIYPQYAGNAHFVKNLIVY